jgi:hypothetical protein
VLAVAAVAGCRGEPTGPVRPSVIVAGFTAMPSGIVGQVLTPAPTFTVRDDKGKALADVPVSVAVIAGGGSLANAPTKTVAGFTPVGQWTLGPAPGVNSLTVSVEGLAPLTISALGRTPYAIDLRFFGPPVANNIEAAFQVAVGRLQTVVTTDVLDVAVTALDVAACDTLMRNVGPLTETIDDLIIFATVTTFDGPGGILGSSGPCFVRTASTANNLPLVSLMKFDVADLQNLFNDGRLNSVVLHEMLHTLGIGTLWATFNLVVNRGTDSTAYRGNQGNTGCLDHGGAHVCKPNAPLETQGGPGTRDVHWRETTFRTELMTGFLSPVGITSPLSRMSIGSLADMGYVVNMNSADAYTVPAALVASATATGETRGERAHRLGEVLLAPKFSVDARGRVTRLPEMR